ncbi:HGxxPAAW family protein [Terracoccus luteus]|jgi:hypothetical protein|uniref:Uncharacterized protein n=1 Tax=Terracoccus luteus TaxID=53356 RepID=A0A495XUH5_9MICO|nr:HGxxPAAW family protein [Terracoccus luteus]MBB2987794.1 hypothetical protein [Terracoccus luteus]MCP2173445.1 hypothetical protein [Terracoccus luteus]RKT78180.1 hypothetical protein DFJ68_1619 [Terracoccus luteus]
MADHDENHGHSTAAWVSVGVILLGTAIASVAVVIPNLVVGIIGAVVMVIGAALGKILSMAGYGSDGHHAQAGGAFADAPDEVGADTRGKS